MQIIIAIRGEVTDETEAQQILDFVQTAIDDHPEKELTATCSITQAVPVPTPP